MHGEGLSVLRAEYLEGLYVRYCRQSFIDDDPVRFVHECREGVESQEVLAFIVSLLCFGRRSQIMGSVAHFLSLLKTSNLYESVYNFSFDVRDFVVFQYRFVQGIDLFILLYKVHRVLARYGSLFGYFYHNFSYHNFSASMKDCLHSFVEGIHSQPLPEELAKLAIQRARYQRFLLPSPYDMSACKRLNLFLKWMLRRDVVDLGLWTGIPKNMLVIPVDTHVAKVARCVGLTRYVSAGWTMACDITDRLKAFDAEDPVKYDIALFALGLELSKKRFV